MWRLKAAQAPRTAVQIDMKARDGHSQPESGPHGVQWLRRARCRSPLLRCRAKQPGVAKQLRAP